MGITVHMDYRFELDGKIYERIGICFADTEKEEDIAEMQEEIEINKACAICHALDLNFDELTDEVERAKFDLVEVYA